MAASRLRLVAVAVLVAQAAANSLYLSKLCRGEMCTDPLYPILDYDKRSGNCTCRANPCWNHYGNTMHCNSPEYPHLRFSYDSHRSLQCECSALPFYSSTHISKNLCPSHRCDDPAFPVLDFDEEQNQCVCRVHPCSLIDKGHECLDARFPLLVYREELPPSQGEEPKKVCECHARLDFKTREDL